MTLLIGALAGSRTELIQSTKGLFAFLLEFLSKRPGRGLTEAQSKSTFDEAFKGNWPLD